MGRGKSNTNPKILHDLKLGQPLKGALPPTRIIGSDTKKDNLSKLPKLEKAVHHWDKYIEYNKEINTHPDYVNHFTPRDNHILIKCYKYESDASTETGIILNNDNEWYETPGGQMKMKTSTNPYQKRAVIVKKGFLPENEFYKLLEEGATVTLSTNKLTSSEFDMEPEKKGKLDLGYFLVHVGVITGIETK